MSKLEKKRKHERWKLYKVEGDKVIRLRKFCPRCGPGVFLADHGDRLSCGKCGYTEYKEPRKVEVSLPDKIIAELSKVAKK